MNGSEKWRDTRRHTHRRTQTHKKQKIRESRFERKQFFSVSSSYCSTQWTYWVCQAHCMLLPVFIVNVVPFFFHISLSFSRSIFLLSAPIPFSYCYRSFEMLLYVAVDIYDWCSFCFDRRIIVSEYLCVCVCVSLAIYRYVWWCSWLLSIAMVVFFALFLSVHRNSYMNGFSFAFHFAPVLIILTCKYMHC